MVHKTASSETEEKLGFISSTTSVTAGICCLLICQLVTVVVGGVPVIAVVFALSLEPLILIFFTGLNIMFHVCTV